MTVFYPEREIIDRFKVPPTPGERTLINFLDNTLDDSYEVYFNPYLNGDRPDVIIMRQHHGVMIIEVKDWDLDCYYLDQKKQWHVKQNDSVVKSPLDQAQQYKDNLFELHVDGLLKMNITDPRNFGMVTCAVYFHNATQDQVENFVKSPFPSDKKYLKYLEHYDLIGHDSLNERNFTEILGKRYLNSDFPSKFFSDDLYENFRRLLAPPIHLKEQGKHYVYSEKQKEIIYSQTLEQRVKGVFGSGKTTVLAARAVQVYKRALKRNAYPHILILTYNITLKNFIHDKLNEVNEEFRPECFTIINYHKFITHELNNMGVKISVPEHSFGDLLSISLEADYYGNYSLFEQHKDKIKKKYDAVLIDEIQDYERVWMDIIKDFFRDPEGDYVLFGDEKQNIYNRPMANKDVVTNVIGRPIELKNCFRSDTKICDLAQLFQKSFFGDKYDEDEFLEDGRSEFMGHSFEKEGTINYVYLNEPDNIGSVYEYIRGKMTEQESGVSPNDITVLGFTIKRLRLFDAYYRYMSREKTNTIMETMETMYLSYLPWGDSSASIDIWINRLDTNNRIKGWILSLNLDDDSTKGLIHRLKLEDSAKEWIFGLRNMVKENMDDHYRNDEEKIRIRMAKLLTVYDLFSTFGNVFEDRLEEWCKKYGISTDEFKELNLKYENFMLVFKRLVYDADYEKIETNLKIHFWMNSGTIKISTIHSFKGWESETVFLIIEPNGHISPTFDEVLYTGMTRCRNNLYIINLGDEEYDRKLRPFVERVNNSPNTLE